MTNEIRDQLQHVIDALAADLYHPLGEITLEGFPAPGARVALKCFGRHIKEVTTR